MQWAHWKQNGFDMIQMIKLPCKWIWIFSFIRGILLLMSCFLRYSFIAYHSVHTCKCLHQWQYDDKHVSDPKKNIFVHIRNTIFFPPYLAPPLQLFPERRSLAMACVFFISAVAHEYVLIMCFKFFYPVLFVMFMGAGCEWSSIEQWILLICN